MLLDLGIAKPNKSNDTRTRKCWVSLVFLRFGTESKPKINQIFEVFDGFAFNPTYEEHLDLFVGTTEHRSGKWK